MLGVCSDSWLPACISPSPQLESRIKSQREAFKLLASLLRGYMGTVSCHVGKDS